MKRSEFIVRVNSARDPMAEAAVAAAEAAGVTWDPEQEPLPERIFAVREGHLRSLLGVEGPREAKRLLTMTEALEVERRYNAWPELRKISRRLSNRAWGDDEDLEMIQRAFDAILDGK